MASDALKTEIKAYRGTGDWTASIIALFYVGHEDFFPPADGALQQAIKLIQERRRRKKVQPFKADLASPYRSYLVLYLRPPLDTGILAR